MHQIKPYLEDLFILSTAIILKIYAYFTGLILLVGNLDLSKFLYVSVMLITGFTTVYRFVKEVRTDRKEKAKRAKKNKRSKK